MISLCAIDENRLELIVCDNGIGISANIDCRKTNSLELTLIKGIVEDKIAGTMEPDKTEGAQFKISFKNNNKINTINA